MSDESNNLYSTLKRGPAFLFLGQDYLRLESGIDPFLSEILRKFNPNVEKQDYYQIIDIIASDSIDSSLAWMQERCNRLSPPSGLKTISKYAWNGIYTSAIDLIWQEEFRLGWRSLQPIFEEKYFSPSPRNRLKLNCTYLFGNVGQSEKNKRPPLDDFEFIEREQVAITLVRRLPEIITPFGILIIEGYAGDRDWFTLKNLIPIINKLNSKQTHIFSATEELKENKLISKLIEREKVVLHEENLASFLSKGEQLGYIKLKGNKPLDENLDHRIQIREKVQYVPTEIWNKVSESATILDDTILIKPTAFSEERRYYDFRTFLLESSIRPIWTGYERQFNFKRDFEKTLYKKVSSKLKSNELQQEPIILHGQTGSGKTVALGALAYKIRAEKKNPVLFIGRNAQPPQESDLDMFCKWAENNDASPVLIIWDGMLKIEHYYSFLRKLVSRGRKVVLVSSSYRINETGIENKNLIEAPIKLNKNEASRFKKFIESFGIVVRKELQTAIETRDDTFLVALYRLLPATREHIRSGVQKETKIAEKMIKELFQKKEVVHKTLFGEALLKAGLIDSDFLLSSENKEIDGEKLDPIEELIDLITVPGRFGLFIPIELLVRAWDKTGHIKFSEVLERIDIVIVDEDNVGNIRIGPRHPLEAKLLVQSRLGTAKAEIIFIQQIILEIKGNYESHGYKNIELQFAIELLKNIGPNSLESSRFSKHYKEIANTLSKLREQRNIHNPRLMLQEATFLREYVIDQSRKEKIPNDAIEVLSKAEAVLDSALSMLGDNDYNNFMKGVILVELASTVGSRIEHLLNVKQLDSEEALKLSKKAQSNIIKARKFNPDNYPPIDVQAWITLVLLKSDILNQYEQAELQADILFSFETAGTEDFNPEQQIKLNERKLEIGNYLKIGDLSDEAFIALEKKGSYAGYYLSAYKEIKDIKNKGVLTKSEILKCETAVNYLKEHYSKISNDPKCLYLLLSAWWKTKTGKSMFYGEKQTVSFSEKDWEYCLELIQKIIGIGDLSTKPSLIYLKGLAIFHLGSIGEALSVFKDLEGTTYQLGKRRIIRSYLASNSSGNPIKYHGTVYSISDDGKGGQIYVEEIRKLVHFVPRDFNRPNIEKDEALDFYLAFNFIGPIAFPLHLFRNS